MIYSNYNQELNKKPSDFCATAFGKRSHILVIRFIFALMITTTLVYDVTKYPSRIGLNLEYLSYWGAYQILAYFWIAVGLGIVDQMGLNNESFKKAGKITGILYQCAFSYQLPICGLFWAVIAPEKLPNYTQEEKMIAVCTHGGYMTLLCIDFLYNSIVFRKRNLFWVGVIGSCYGFWNLGIVMTTGIPIYTIMDWRSMKSYIFCTAAVLAMLIQFTIGW